MTEVESSEIKPENKDDTSTETDKFNQDVENSGNQITVSQLKGLPPRPGIVPQITGDTSVKDLGMVMVEALMDLNNNLEAKTRISGKEIMMFAKGMMEALRYGPVDNEGLATKNNVMWHYCLNRLKLAVSKAGGGRGEVVKISNAISKLEQELKARDEKQIKV